MRVLGNTLTELCKMQMVSKKLKCMRYSTIQKWLTANILIGSGKTGYRLFQQTTQLPPVSTVFRLLRKYRTSPGLKKDADSLLKLKVKPQSLKDQMCFLQFDEMSLRCGLNYDKKTGSIVGFQDDGILSNKKLAVSAFGIMAAGIVRR